MVHVTTQAQLQNVIDFAAWLVMGLRAYFNILTVSHFGMQPLAAGTQPLQILEHCVPKCPALSLSFVPCPALSSGPVLPGHVLCHFIPSLAPVPCPALRLCDSPGSQIMCSVMYSDLMHCHASRPCALFCCQARAAPWPRAGKSGWGGPDRIAGAGRWLPVSTYYLTSIVLD